MKIEFKLGDRVTGVAARAGARGNGPYVQRLIDAGGGVIDQLSPNNVYVRLTGSAAWYSYAHSDLQFLRKRNKDR